VLILGSWYKRGYVEYIYFKLDIGCCCFFFARGWFCNHKRQKTNDSLEKGITTYIKKKKIRSLQFFNFITIDSKGCIKKTVGNVQTRLVLSRYGWQHRLIFTRTYPDYTKFCIAVDLQYKPLVVVEKYMSKTNTVISSLLINKNYLF
jgi:hypothetical protein